MANTARQLSHKEPTLEEAKAYIDALNLTAVIERVMKEKRWTRRMGEIAAGFYKNFLYLSKKYSQHALTPTQQIDEIWHAHILYTQDYHEACNKIFGYYLHHRPFHKEEGGEPSEETGIKFLQELHEKEFGTSIYDAVYSLKDLQLFIRKAYKT